MTVACWARNSLNFIDPQDVLLRSHDPITDLWSATHTATFYLFKFLSVASPSAGPLCTSFWTKTWYAFLIGPIRATCFVYLIPLPYLNILMMSDEEHRLWAFQSRNDLNTHYFRSLSPTYCQHLQSMLFSWSVDQATCPYKNIFEQI